MKLLIVDGSSLLTTSYFANIPNGMKMAKTVAEREVFYPQLLQSHDGLYTNAIYGFLSTFLNLVKCTKPDYLAVCWDKSRNTFRRNMYPEYKAQRKETDEPLKQQFINMELLLDFIGIKCFMSESFEADDFAGTLGKKFGTGLDVIYFTKDEDYLQLVNKSSVVWMPNKKVFDSYAALSMTVPSYLPKDVFEYNENVLMADKGLFPYQIIEYKGLCGDSSDNIPGISGIGPKTATTLLQNFGSVKNIYEFLNGKETKEIQKYFKDHSISRCPIEKLIAGKENAFLSTELATIKTDIEICEPIENIKFEIHEVPLRRILKRLDFNVDKMVNRLK